MCIGIGDNTQWFICQKSFEAYSVFKVHSLKHMGFLVDEEDDHCSSMWSKWRDKKGFAEGMVFQSLSITMSTRFSL